MKNFINSKDLYTNVESFGQYLRENWNNCGARYDCQSKEYLGILFIELDQIDVFENFLEISEILTNLKF